MEEYRDLSVPDEGEDNEEKKNEKEEKKKEEKKEEKKELPSFEETIKECEKLEGLFSFYVKEDEGKVLMEIMPDQFEKIFLCSLTRQAAEGYYFDSGAMMWQFPFLLKRVGKRVQLIHKNVRFRADERSPIRKAVERGVSDSIIGSAKVESKPHPDKGSILVDAKGFFVQDIAMVAYSLSEWAKAEYSFDEENSYIELIKPYQQNVEIEVAIHFKSTKPKSAYTVADSRSFFHRYHYSLSAIPETDYRPRLGDDRVGHFLTMYQDYTDLTRETPYVRYVERWHLEKADPDAELSPPKKPIVFWLENTIPPEYREAVKEGILLWNKAFERIGFKDAIQVKEQPEDADWEAGDIRYNTIRWIVHPGGSYAVGPSRANPFTGEIYHADIRIGADMIRAAFGELEEFVDPVSLDVDRQPPESSLPGKRSFEAILSNHQMGLALHAAFGWHLLSAREGITPDDPKAKEYLHDFIVHLVAHEVGHTLGLRHNFKGSILHPVDKLQDKELTATTGLTSSIMDYVPVNIAPEGVEQGHYWQTTLGPYDYWAIEYAYKPIDATTPEEELEELERIASKVADPELPYGTDEDAFFGPMGIDPTCNRWDLGEDVLEYHKKQIALAKELWSKVEEHFAKPGTRYQKIRRAFGYGLAQYRIAAMNVPKYIGGIYHRRDHIGDPGGRLPFEPVPPSKQREVLEFLATEFFGPDAFKFSPGLLNKLAPERFWDFQDTVWRMERIDYPLHEVVISIQRRILNHLYHPILLSRLLDIELRYGEGEDKFTMAEMFQRLREAIWSELEGPTNINSFRRALQREHLAKLIELVLKPGGRTPQDASSLARMDLIAIKDGVERALSEGEIDAYTRAHLDETLARIEVALKPVVEKRLTG
jgi:hypothetical protein